jgi:hypothetical protein
MSLKALKPFLPMVLPLLGPQGPKLLSLVEAFERLGPDAANVGSVANVLINWILTERLATIAEIRSALDVASNMVHEKAASSSPSSSHAPTPKPARRINPKRAVAETE